MDIAEIPEDGRTAQISQENLAHPHPADQKAKNCTQLSFYAAINTKARAPCPAPNEKRNGSGDLLLAWRPAPQEELVALSAGWRCLRRADPARDREAVRVRGHGSVVFHARPAAGQVLFELVVRRSDGGALGALAAVFPPGARGRRSAGTREVYVRKHVEWGAACLNVHRR